MKTTFEIGDKVEVIDCGCMGTVKNTLFRPPDGHIEYSVQVSQRVYHWCTADNLKLVNPKHIEIDENEE